MPTVIKVPMLIRKLRVISLDLVTANGMVVDKHKNKTLHAVNGFVLKCCGAVTFQVTVRGQRTGVLALVMPLLSQEILLRTLQRLGVIPSRTWLSRLSGPKW